jgi:hypothetical protein
MKSIRILAGAALAATSLGAASAKPVDDLVAGGFVVVKDTSVIGDFDGCDYDRKVPLKGGGVFTCSGFGYLHARDPKAVLLKSKDGRTYKLVIQNAVFDGAFGGS